MSKREPYVPTMRPPGLITAEELPRIAPRDKRAELVRGRLVVSEPPGFRHGKVTAELTFLLMSHVKKNGLGLVLAAETGFKLFADPDTVRAPDIAFLRNERIPEPPPAGFAAVAPDLAVEVLSPNDRPGETLAKVGDWLDAGTRLVWVVDPARNLVRVYRDDGSETLVGPDGVLSGEEVVPGFSCPLSSFF